MMENFDCNLFADALFEESVWWFQDWAPCHRQQLITHRIRELFGNQVVALPHVPEWPPRSPLLATFSYGVT